MAALDAAATEIDEGSNVTSVLREHVPWLVDGLRSDAHDGTVLEWGRSTVIDEHVGGPVIGRSLFDALHALAGVDAEWPVGNAGVIHCYGYLLSTVETPFGLKRERWTGGAVAAALGLGDRLAPGPAERSLLSRITAAVLPVLREPTDSDRTHVVAVLDEYPVGARQALPATAVRDPVARTVVVRSALPHGAGEYDYALLYGVGAAHGPSVVTAFPVREPTPEWLAGLSDQPSRFRYNAVALG